MQGASFVTRPTNLRTSAAPREIATDVYWLSPRGRTQTNIYFVRAEPSWALVDTGWAGDGPRIVEAAESLFGAQIRPAAILLTHFHPDHAGSARQLARIWERPVDLDPAELPLAQGDFATISKYAGPLDHWVVLPLMRAMGRRRREAMLTGSSLRDVARPLGQGAEVPGLPGWHRIPTPGHTPGHISFFRASDRVLITGDALVTLELNSLSGLLRQRQGLSGPPWYTSWNWRAAKVSVARLAKLEPRVLAGGHGIPLTGTGVTRALEAFAERFSGRASS